jgi:urocanate hydratase
MPKSSTMSSSGPTDATRAVDRALSLLEHIVTSDTPPNLTEAARLAELPVSTAARLLKGLERRRLVRRSAGGRYWPGTRMFHLAASAMRSLPVHDLADEHLRALTAATGESSYLLIPVEPRFAVYVRQCESPSSVRYASWLGRTIPLSGTASGAAFRGELDEGGFASARDAIEPDTATAAAPVIDASGEIQAVISVIAPSFRVDDDQLRAIGELVAEHGRTLSAQLGAPDRPGVARETALP